MGRAKLSLRCNSRNLTDKVIHDLNFLHLLSFRLPDFVDQNQYSYKITISDYRKSLLHYGKIKSCSPIIPIIKRKRYWEHCYLFVHKRRTL